MLADELVQRIEASGSLEGMSKTDGLSQAFFNRVHHLFASDHGALLGLAPAARSLIAIADDPAVAHRALGIVERVRGNWMGSARAFLRAGTLAKSPRDRSAFSIGAIDSLSRAGRSDQAIALGRKISADLGSLGERDLAARASLNLSYALMNQDRYAEAWAVLSDLPEQLGSGGFEVEAISARLALSTSHLFGGDPGVARAEAERVVVDATALELDYLADLARCNIACVDLLRGDVDLALGELLPIRERLRDTPVDFARALEFIGDAHMALNLWPEAIDAYREALGVGRPIQPLHRAHLQLGLGQAMVVMGKPADALTELSAASRRYRQIGNLAWHAAAEASRAEVEFSMGKKTATRRFEMAIASARLAKSRYHLARALVGYADAMESEAPLAEAHRLVQKGGYARLEWRMDFLRARLAEPKSRLKHFRKMLRSILSEQIRASSFAARSSFLKDKSRAIQSYLETLLAYPTAERVREARSVIAQCRSVTLLDELLSARREVLPAGALKRLESLRFELNHAGSEHPTRGPRFAPISGGSLDHLQRLWVEETHSVLEQFQMPRTTPQEGTMVFVETSGEYLALTGVAAQGLRINQATLRAKLGWLAYEITAPMLSQLADPCLAMKALGELGGYVVPETHDQKVLGICPDGGLWRIPWQACADAMELKTDIEVRLHPDFEGTDATIDPDRVLLWVADHLDLPNAKHESAAFLELFPNATVCQNSREARESLLGGTYSVLHVISHAHHRPRHPMFSSIDFTDGPILAAEIARSQFRADLVTLSGCDTGRISDVNHFEPEGLVRAFLACGAGFVIGSAWPLDDEAAVRLYSQFYHHRMDNQGTHESLRNAREAVKKWKSHPYFWASPLLYAGYRP